MRKILEAKSGERQGAGYPLVAEPVGSERCELKDGVHELNEVSEGVVGAASEVSEAERDAVEFLNGLWRSPGNCHLIGMRNPLTGEFQNKGTPNARDAVARARQLSKNGKDAYFACAEYLTEKKRTGANASGAWAFWVDLDCGAGKAADGKGYESPAEAERDLERFCGEAGVPLPTHKVASGGGIHAYWVMKSVVPREVWKEYASKLKAVAKALEFLADPTRTADIASVLRVPGTSNFKYAPPRPVTLLSATNVFIELPTMLGAIDKANSQWCPVVPHPQSAWAEKTCGQPCCSDLLANIASPSDSHMHLLAVILGFLDPDCGRSEWFGIAGALYYETGCSQEGYELFDAWSSVGAKYKGRRDTKGLWTWFKPDSVRKYNMGTLRRMVEAAGHDWYEVCASAEEQFEVIGDDTEGGE